MDELFDPAELDSMKRRQLQTLAKKCGIKANSKNVVIIEMLKEWHAEEYAEAEAVEEAASEAVEEENVSLGVINDDGDDDEEGSEIAVGDMSELTIDDLMDTPQGQKTVAVTEADDADAEAEEGVDEEDGDDGMPPAETSFERDLNARASQRLAATKEARKNKQSLQGGGRRALGMSKSANSKSGRNWDKIHAKHAGESLVEHQQRKAERKATLARGTSLRKPTVFTTSSSKLRRSGAGKGTPTMPKSLRRTKSDNPGGARQMTEAEKRASSLARRKAYDPRASIKAAPKPKYKPRLKWNEQEFAGKTEGGAATPSENNAAAANKMVHRESVKKAQKGRKSRTQRVEKAKKNGLQKGFAKRRNYRRDVLASMAN